MTASGGPYPESESLYRQIVETTHEGVWLVDLEGRTLYVNSQMAKMLGRTVEEMLGKTIFDFMSVTARVEAQDNLARRKSGVSENHDFCFLKEDGTELWTIIATNPFHDGDGKITGALGLITDITARKRAEIAAELTRKLLENTSRIVRVGGWHLDVAKEALYWSQVTREIHEVPPDFEPDLQTAINFYKEGESRERIAAAVAEGMKHGKSWNLELQVITAKGREIEVLANGEVFFEKGAPTQIYGSFQDITARKKFERELVTAKETAEAANNLKSRIIDTAAHELRTPITAFSLLLEFAERRLEAGSAVELPTVKRLRAQAERLSRLVIELLASSRLDRGLVILKKSPTELKALVENCLDDFRLQFPLREFIFQPTAHSFEAEIDSLRITQVLSNLLENAVKYTPTHHPIKITLEDTTADKIKVSVIDQGIGIPENQHPDLFTPFTRGNSEEVERTSGLGLGLFISNSIVVLHGGTLGVHSEPGKGSMFFFELPKGPKAP